MRLSLVLAVAAAVASAVGRAPEAVAVQYSMYMLQRTVPHSALHTPHYPHVHTVPVAVSVNSTT